MSNIIVTLKSNVKQSENGEILLNDQGVPVMIDPDDIGILVKSHPIMTVKFNQETQEIESGYQTRSEVYWDKHRNPSPSMHKPADLVWLEFMEENSGEAEAEDFDDEDFIDEEGTDHLNAVDDDPDYQDAGEVEV